MFLKIVTIVATVTVLVVIFYPFVAPMLERPWVMHERTHFCDRCTRSYRDAATLAWHRSGMHQELPIEFVVDAVTVVPVANVVVPVANVVAPPSEPPVELTEPVVEICSGGVVYHVIAGGRK